MLVILKRVDQKARVIPVSHISGRKKLCLFWHERAGVSTNPSFDGIGFSWAYLNTYDSAIVIDDLQGIYDLFSWRE